MVKLTWTWVALLLFTLGLLRLCGRGRRDGTDFLKLMPHLTISKKARGRGLHPGRRRNR